MPQRLALPSEKALPRLASLSVELEMVRGVKRRLLSIIWKITDYQREKVRHKWLRLRLRVTESLVKRNRMEKFRAVPLL
ncbi:uncharacterized protein M6B38_156740 [Iris pallida]|uniref:Ribosomal protein S15 n=1 Tax=Iris pallida TaxID=29817 RepID=A0AAX6F2F3_IRIPA|nr:uncharacterized protein M6B38_156740 [Iris pallida]